MGSGGVGVSSVGGEKVCGRESGGAQAQVEQGVAVSGEGGGGFLVQVRFREVVLGTAWAAVAAECGDGDERVGEEPLRGGEDAFVVDGRDVGACSVCTGRWARLGSEAGAAKHGA